MAKVQPQPTAIKLPDGSVGIKKVNVSSDVDKAIQILKGISANEPNPTRQQHT